MSESASEPPPPECGALEYGSPGLSPAGLQWGEPAPRFTAPIDGVERYSIEVAAGRFMLLLAFGSLSNPACRDAHEAVLRRRSLFDDANAVFFGLSIDPEDKIVRGVTGAPVGVRYFWDFDRSVSERLGLIGGGFFRPRALLIDRSFRIAFSGPVEAVSEALERLERALDEERASEAPHAPVLALPRVFEPELCRALIEQFLAGSPSESGFAADVGGQTVTLLNPDLKRRQDVTIEDGPLRQALESRIRRRLLPAVETAFAARPSEIERYLVCRYGEADRGFFSAHRDNVTAGTAHRRFAVSINLDADAHEGGDLRFPEYGPRLYRPSTGGAVVFSCSLLHEATPVTRGVRYAFVPFLNGASPLLRAGTAGGSASARRTRRNGERR